MKIILKIFLALVLIANAAEGEPIRITFKLDDLSSAKNPVTGFLKLVSSSGPVQARELPAQAPGEQQVEGEPGTSWEVHFEAKGFWSETLTLRYWGTASEARPLRIFRAGGLRARVTATAGEHPLRSLVLRLQSPPTVGSGLSGVVIACPIKD